MREWPNLRRAPIAEALIDIAVEPASQPSSTSLLRVRDRLAGSLPLVAEHASWMTEVALGPSARIEKHEGGADGYMLRSSDGLRVLQARSRGLTMSVLRPYRDWSDLRSRTAEFWDVYVQEMAPARVQRVAVRAINEIRIPAPIRDLADWIKTAPTIAEGLPSQMQQLFMRVVLPVAERDAFVTITEFVQPPREEGFVSLVFDIEAHRVVAADPGGAELWTAVDQLHHVRNEVFFGSVTERCLELFR